MRSTIVLAAGLLIAVLAVVGVVLFLDEEPDAGGGAAVVATREDERPEAMALPEFEGAEAEPLEFTGGGVPGAPTPEDTPRKVLADGTPTRTLSGRVLRLADRSPVTGRRLASGAEETTTDDADGTFSFRALPGDRTINLGLPRRWVVVPLPETEGDLTDLELVVDTGWIVHGSVTSPRGDPIPGAGVVVAGERTPCGSGGLFRVKDVAPGGRPDQVRVVARAPGHAEESLPAFLFPDVRVAPPLAFELHAAGSIEGWLRATPGRGVEGMPVEVLLELQPRGFGRVPETLRANADAEGRYRIDGVPEGTYLVLAGPPPRDVDEVAVLRALGYVDDTAPADLDLHTTARVWLRDVVVRSGEATRLDVDLPEGAGITGVARDGSGAALAGVRVEAVREETWTFERGRQAESTVRGFAAQVSVDGTGRVSSRVGAAESAADGTYAIGGLPPGPIRLVATTPSQPGWQAETRELVVAAGERRAVDLVLGTGLAVRGTVVDLQGRPVADARVALDDPDDADGSAAGHPQWADLYRRMKSQHVASGLAGHATRDGAFDFAGLDDRPYVLVATAPRHRAERLEVQPGDRALQVVLAPARVIEARVVDARTGEPVAEAPWELRGEQLHQMGGNPLEDGRLLVDDLPEGAYALTIRAAGYREWTRQDLWPSATGEVIEVRMEPLR